MSNFIVMGGSGGLGQQVMWALLNKDHGIIDFSKATGVELLSDASINVALAHGPQNIHGIINCAGINCLRPFDQLTQQEFMNTMLVNAWALPRVVQAFRKVVALEGMLLVPGARICNVISNAADIPMTHSLAYNASKAAQKMITRQMARELKEYSIFGVMPNKLEGTPMSREIEQQVLKLRGWSAEEAQRYQLAALPAGVETPPKSCAEFIVDLVTGPHHPFITGCIFPYGGP